MSWELHPGDQIVRKELHNRYGGGRQSGMSPSRQSPNVLLFTDAASGEQHGYYDGWGSDGVFEYSGEGQQGDQQMTAGNKALLEHRHDGRSVRLFSGTGGMVVYEGEFEVDSGQPFVERRAHSSGGGPDRRVFVFRLRPASLGGPLTGAPEGVTPVPIAHQNVETWNTSPSSSTQASAVESRLVKRYQRHLEAKGHSIVRHRYLSSRGYLFNDIFNETRGQLIEAKGSSGRGDIRMAIGQLLDYQKLEPHPPPLGLLLPETPEVDIAELLSSINIAVIFPDGRGFADTVEGSFS